MKQQESRGFTLIEVIVAMAVFTIGALGLYAMQFNSAEGNTRANQQTGAVAVATQAVETLMRTSYGDPALDPATNPHNNVNPDDNLNIQLGQAPYIQAITWNVTDLGAVDPDAQGVKQVDLTVTYFGNRQVNITFLRIALI